MSSPPSSPKSRGGRRRGPSDDDEGESKASSSTTKAKAKSSASAERVNPEDAVIGPEGRYDGTHCNDGALHKEATVSS